MRPPAKMTGVVEWPIAAASVRLLVITVSSGRSDRYGTKHSEETKKKMSEATKLRNNKVYERKKSEDERKKLSESAKNRQKVVCPYCNKIGDITGIKRWHFNNCKNKK